MHLGDLKSRVPSCVRACIDAVELGWLLTCASLDNVAHVKGDFRNLPSFTFSYMSMAGLADANTSLEG